MLRSYVKTRPLLGIRIYGCLLINTVCQSFQEKNFSVGCKAATAPSLAAIQFWSFWKLRSYVKTRPVLGIRIYGCLLINTVCQSFQEENFSVGCKAGGYGTVACHHSVSEFQEVKVICKNRVVVSFSNLWVPIQIGRLSLF